MAFQPPNSGQERQNRKILEQLEEQKKRLRLQNQPGGSANPIGAPGQGAPMSPNQPMSPVSGGPGLAPMLMPDTQAMTAAQRTALQHANANSVGYFITQDSSFGNLILPVLPRFEKIPQ